MQAVERHYALDDIEKTNLRALEKAGKGLDQLSLDDLAQVDEFHIRGPEATREMAEEIGLNAQRQVLDVGCGPGGPSRRLASEYGCRVAGVDLIEAYCRVCGE